MKRKNENNKRIDEVKKRKQKKNVLMVDIEFIKRKGL